MRLDGDAVRKRFHYVCQIERCADVEGFEGKWAVIRVDSVHATNGDFLNGSQRAIAVYDTRDAAYREAERLGMDPKSVP